MSKAAVNEIGMREKIDAVHSARDTGVNEDGKSDGVQMESCTR